MKDETKGRDAASSGKKRRPRLIWGEGKTERGSNVEKRGRNGVVAHGAQCCNDEGSHCVEAKQQQRKQ